MSNGVADRACTSTTTGRGDGAAPPAGGAGIGGEATGGRGIVPARVAAGASGAVPASAPRVGSAADPPRRHREMRDRPLIGRKPREIRPHLVAHRRVQRRGQRSRVVEHHLVPLQRVRAPQRDPAHPVQPRADLDCAYPREPRHDRGVMREVIFQPRNVIRRATLVRNEVGARRRPVRVRHRKAPRQHRLLRRPLGQQRRKRRERPGRRHRRLQRLDGREIQLQRHRRRRPVVQVGVGGAGRRVHQPRREPRRRPRRACHVLHRCHRLRPRRGHDHITKQPNPSRNSARNWTFARHPRTLRRMWDGRMHATAQEGRAKGHRR